MTKEAPEYLPGKTSELACGFQGGVGAFQAMAATLGLVIEDGPADTIKTNWRVDNPMTVKLWDDLEKAAFRAVLKPNLVQWAGDPKVSKIGFLNRQGVLWMQLPSGRRLILTASGLRTRNTELRAKSMEAARLRALEHRPDARTEQAAMAHGIAKSVRLAER